jgi:Glycosyltransferase family 87
MWDGRVQSAGINPYQYIPADPHFAGLRDTNIYPHINRRTYPPTIYPPMAQIIFFAIHQVTGTVTGFKACLLVFETITLCCLARLLRGFGLPRERLLIYAWNPVVVWEFSGSGRSDAVMITFVALALVARKAQRDVLTGLLLGAAVLTKFFPLVLFPAFYRRWSWKMPLALVLTCAIGYTIYLGAGWRVLGFLAGYANEEGINSRRYFLLACPFVSRQHRDSGRDVSLLRIAHTGGYQLPRRIPLEPKRLPVSGQRRPARVRFYLPALASVSLVLDLDRAVPRFFAAQKTAACFSDHHRSAVSIRNLV